MELPGRSLKRAFLKEVRCGERGWRGELRKQNRKEKEGERENLGN